MMHFNEDTRVKIPATIQFMRIGYQYQSLKDAEIDFETKIFVNRFKPALEKINGKPFSEEEVIAEINNINTLIKNNDLGYEKPKLLAASICPGSTDSILLRITSVK